MRNYSEPSCRHLLRQPLVGGIPMAGMIVLSCGTVLGQVLAQGSATRSCVGLGFSALSYATMRILTRYAKPGWDQEILFLLERTFAKRQGSLGRTEESASPFAVIPPDTLDEDALLSSKIEFYDQIEHLSENELLVLRCRVTEQGARLSLIAVKERCERIAKPKDLAAIVQNLSGEENPNVYSLYAVPVLTDPLWLFGHLRSLAQNYQVIVAIRGVNPSKIKAQIESYRRINSQLNDTDEIDLSISHEDASHVLRGLSRGDDCVVEISLILISATPLRLDTNFFLKEKSAALPLIAGFGLRGSFHRGHLVRSVTATDLIPNILDPHEGGSAILRTLRGKPLYFDPLDSRLDALHWLVCGATGTGKSFLVGLVLHRMIQAGRPLSVLFVDHKRSFKRIVGACGGVYVEPNSKTEVDSRLQEVLFSTNQAGKLAGIELSDLPLSDKKEAASQILRRISEFLSSRDSAHVLYIVLDECWKFLKHDSQGVQEAFREFRKFDAAAIAITQSLKDFISDEAGQSIIQNADVTVLLRQKEDVTRFQDVLDLTHAEMANVKQITKRKGEYSECLIKTPFLSRFGRLYPTHEEHELLRTDNLRAERVSQARESLNKGEAHV